MLKNAYSIFGTQEATLPHVLEIVGKEPCTLVQEVTGDFYHINITD